MCLSLEILRYTILTGYPILVKLIDQVNSVTIFLSQTNLILMVNFTLRIPDCDSRSSAFLDLFISSDTSICSAMVSHWKTLIMLLSQFPLAF